MYRDSRFRLHAKQKLSRAVGPADDARGSRGKSEGHVQTAARLAQTTTRTVISAVVAPRCVGPDFREARQGSASMVRDTARHSSAADQSDRNAPAISH